MVQIDRNGLLAYRLNVQGLINKPGSIAPADVPLLDFGVQDTGPDGARWALVIRGAGPELPAPVPDLALAWTLRGAPHLHRRTDLPAVARAVHPYSSADAAKRIFDAAKPLKAADIDPLMALHEVAAAERVLVAEPMVKGEMSRQLAEVMDEPYLRYCSGCAATHLYEMPFRLAALQAGLELQAGTSPPVLERIPGWAGLEEDESTPVMERFDLIRNYLHFYGPATPKHVAGFLDASLVDVKARWPADAVEVERAGEKRWMLAADSDALADGATPTGSGTP